VNVCTRCSASVGVGNWLLKAVGISELPSANGLVLPVQSDDLQRRVGMWSRERARRDMGTVRERVKLCKCVYTGC
jgi:hypothetical protein